MALPEWQSRLLRASLCATSNIDRDRVTTGRILRHLLETLAGTPDGSQMPDLNSTFPSGKFTSGIYSMTVARTLIGISGGRKVNPRSAVRAQHAFLVLNISHFRDYSDAAGNKKANCTQLSLN